MKKQDKILITLGTAAVIAFSGFVGYSLFATPDQTAANTTSSHTTTTNTSPSQSSESTTTAPSAHSNTASTSSSSYRDGTYTATSSYIVPHGAQNSITGTVVVSSGKISSVTTTNDYSDHESANYIDWFEQEISPAVTGQDIGDVSVSRVGGASLTSSAFNDVLDTIRSKASA